MLLVDSLISAASNLIVLTLLPFAFYAGYHKWKHRRGLTETARRAGLAVGDPRYIGYCAAAAVVAVVLLLIWPPSLSASTAEGSAFRAFSGLPLGPTSVTMALLYGVVQTGFAEEFLFRGLVAGSLGRRLQLKWANVAQAVIFLMPHLFILVVAPAMWPLLLIVFASALFKGWVRIESGSVLGPWLLHAAVNTTTALSIVVRS